jgi:hypothetical protein
MKSSRLLLACLPLLCLCATGCISSQRMARAMPWSEAAGPGQVRDDRVNLWPLLYQAGDMTSVLWPLADFDRRGFAVRPLLVQDGADWSLLFPLSGWNTQTGNGWFLTGYRSRHNLGFFPLFNVGDGFNYATLAWWNERGNYGLFPVAGRFDDVRHLGPVYWKGGHDPAGGLFPLAHVDPGDGAWLFPLYSYSHSDQRLRHLVALGLLGGWDRDDARNRTTSWLTPLWFGRRTPDTRTDLLLPLYWYQADGPRRHFVTPLGGRGWATDGSRDMINVLGPLFHYDSAGEDDRLLSLLWPLFIDRRKPGPERSTLLLPLFWDWRTADSSGTITLLGGAGQNHKTDERWLNVLLLLYHHSRGPGDAYRLGLLIPAFYASRDASGRRQHGIPLLYHRQTDEYHSSFDALLWLFQRQRRGQADENATYFTRLFPLFSNRTALAAVDFNLLFGLLSSYELAEDRSRFTLLRYLYRRERDGDRVATDIFPFLSFDRGPDSRRDAFLWRLYHYRRDGDRRGGHLLFIPWGDTD